MRKTLLSLLHNLYVLITASSLYRIYLTLFLSPIFFVLHAYNENFGIIPVSVALCLLFKYFLITLGIVIINLILFRSPVKRFVYAFLLLLLYFSFGAFHDMLKSKFPGAKLQSYSILLPTIFIVYLAVYWWLYRYKKPLIKITRYLSLLLLIMVGFEIMLSLYYMASDKEKENDIAGKLVLRQEKSNDCTEFEKPDIYFIVFDGYTSSKELKESFDFHNQKIDSLFTANNFFVSWSSKSNYNFTAYSLASTFNMDYVKEKATTGPVFPKNILQAVNTMKENNLVWFLKKNGYEFRNYGRFEMNHLPSKDIAFFDYFYYDLIDKQTLYARVMRDIGWHLYIKNIFTGKPKIPQSFIKNRTRQVERNKKNYAQLVSELNHESDSPRFVYAHIMLPHEPFFLKSDGTFMDDYAILHNTLDQKQAYIGQVQYTNSLLEQLISLSTKNSKRKKVVIIEGDHGYRFYDKNNLHKEFPNLNAYYFSDHNYKMLYDGISPVNTFRVVLNGYFCFELPLLRDTSYYLKKPEQ